MDVNDLIIKYGIGLGRRYKRKEKNIFVNEAGKDFKALGYEVRGVIGKKKGKKGLNLLVGNVSQAKTIFIAHYDTPAHNFGNPIRYFPFDGPATFSSRLLPTYAPLILTGVLAVILLSALGKKINFETNFAMSVIMLILLAALAVVATVMTLGIGNKVNLNRNTSGVITLMKTADKMPEKLRGQVAFVLTDGGCEEHTGDYMMREALPNTLKNRNIILMDCVGTGPRLGIGYQKRSEALGKKLASMVGPEQKVFTELCTRERMKYTSLSFYENGIVVSRGKKSGESLIVENSASNHDDQIEAELIEQTSDLLVRLTEEISK